MMMKTSTRVIASVVNHQVQPLAHSKTTKLILSSSCGYQFNGMLRWERKKSALSNYNLCAMRGACVCVSMVSHTNDN